MGEAAETSRFSILNTGIGGKLFASFLGMAILVAVFAIVAGSQTTVLEGNLRRLTDELIPVLTDVEALSRSIMELSSEALATETNRVNSHSGIGIFAEHQMVLIEAEGMMEGSISSLDLLLVERYREAWTQTRTKVEVFSQLAKEILTRSPDASLPSESARIEALEDAAIGGLQEIRVLTLEELHERHSSTDRALRRAVIAQRTALIVALLFAILVSVFLTHRFVSPLQELSEAVRQVGLGSFAISVKTSGKDELAQLGMAFNSMAVALQTTTVSKTDLDLILASMTEGLCVVDAAGHVGQTNPAWLRIFAATPNRLGVPTLEELWPALNRELLAHRLSGEAASEPKEVPLERESDKRIFRAMFQEIKKLSAGGSATLIVVQDISQALRSEADLREFREKMLHAGQLASLGGVAAILSHKLNQPLTVLRLLLQQMQRSVDKPEVMDSKLRTALEEIDIVSKQIREVLEYSRPLDSTKRIEIDLAPLVRRTAELFVRPYQDERIELDLESLEDLPLITGNEDQLEEAFYILFENALHARPEGKPSCVTVRARHDDDRLLLSVSDTGVGIPSTLAQRVFEPFFTTKPPTKGSGLGLARLKQILLAHDGNVWLESEEFKGTTVFLSFPLDPASKEELRFSSDEVSADAKPE